MATVDSPSTRHDIVSILIEKITDCETEDIYFAGPGLLGEITWKKGSDYEVGRCMKVFIEWTVVS